MSITQADAVGGVSGSGNQTPDCFHAASLGLLVSRWATDIPDEVAADGFEQRAVCIQTRITDATVWTSGRQIWDGRLVPGAWRAHTPGETFRSVARQGYDLVFLIVPEIALESALLANGIVKSTGEFEIVNAGLRPSPFLLALGDELKNTLLAKAPSPALYIDNLCLTLLSHLVRRHSNLTNTPVLLRAKPRGGLAPWQVHRVCEYLGSNLAANAGLIELAALIGVSVVHLCRGFKASTGLPPHAWLVARRLESARELLGNHGLRDRGDRRAGRLRRTKPSRPDVSAGTRSQSDALSAGPTVMRSGSSENLRFCSR
jgi:AraC-like DNA-binding protein